MRVETLYIRLLRQGTQINDIFRTLVPMFWDSFSFSRMNKNIFPAIWWKVIFTQIYLFLDFFWHWTHLNQITLKNNKKHFKWYIGPTQLLNCQWNSCDIDDCQMLKYQSSQSYKVLHLLDLSFWSWTSWEYVCLWFWWLIF